MADPAGPDSPRARDGLWVDAWTGHGVLHGPVPPPYAPPRLLLAAAHVPQQAGLRACSGARAPASARHAVRDCAVFAGVRRAWERRRITCAQGQQCPEAEFGARGADLSKRRPRRSGFATGTGWAVCGRAGGARGATWPNRGAGVRGAADGESKGTEAGGGNPGPDPRGRIDVRTDGFVDRTGWTGSPGRRR